MYESPIRMNEIITNPIVEKIENELLVKVTRTVGFDVDKEELLKALKYDRDQYEKGFRDGVASAQQWIPVSERLPENDTTVLVYRPTMIIKYMQAYYFNGFCDGMYDLRGNEVITHWMPLPQPPKDVI